MEMILKLLKMIIKKKKIENENQKKNCFNSYNFGEFTTLRF